MNDYTSVLKNAVPCKGTIRVEDPEKTKVRDARLVAAGKKPGSRPAMKSVKCGHKPKIVTYAGLYYAQCPCCHKWDPYQFLGATPKTAVDQWNLYNSKSVIDDEI